MSLDAPSRSRRQRAPRRPGATRIVAVLAVLALPFLGHAGDAAAGDTVVAEAPASPDTGASSDTSGKASSTTSSATKPKKKKKKSSRKSKSKSKDASAKKDELEKIKHTVRKGETVVEIAKRYGVSRTQLVRWNKKKLDDPEKIHPGDKLTLYVPAVEKPVTGLEGAAALRDTSAAKERPASPYPVNEEGVAPPMEGFAYPYSYDNLMRGFDGGGCDHQGLDIGGVGEDGGVGDPVYAIVKAEVVIIGLPEEEPRKYGRPDKRGGYETRGGKQMPRKLEVEGYGTVYPFTRSNGSARTGVFLVTRAIGTELDGHSVRYLHLAAVHPDLKVGDVVEAGQEIGLMGATGFKETSPHLHLDIEQPDGVRVDPAPFIGLAELRPSSCKPVNKHKRKGKKKKGKGKKGKKGKGKKVTHTVKKGQSVSRIAKKYKVSSRDIIKWNDLDDADSLRAGQKLKIYDNR